MQKMINLDLNSENMNNLHFLRLQGLIPTKEQHETVKYFSNTDTKMICIDQNPLAILARYQMMDKSPGIFKLLRTHDQSLTGRIKDFQDDWLGRKKEMEKCRNYIYDHAAKEWDKVNRLGLN